MIESIKYVGAALVVLAVSYLPVNFLRAYVQGSAFAWIALACFCACMIIIPLVAAKIFRIRFFAADARSFMWSMAFGGLALTGAVLFGISFGSLFGITITSGIPTELSYANTIVYGVGLSLFAAVGEETAFRGVLQSWLSTRLPSIRAVLITTVVFCLWHVGNAHFAKLFPYYLIVGFALGLVYSLSGALGPILLLHFLLNLVLNLVYWAFQPVHFELSPSNILTWIHLTVTACLLLAVAFGWALPRLRSSVKV